MNKILTLSLSLIFLSPFTFAGSSGQFGGKRKSPGQDPYKQYVFCVETSMEKGMSQEHAEKECDQILDGSKGYGLRGDSRDARDNKRLIAYGDGDTTYTVSSSSFERLLRFVDNSKIEITKEGVFLAGGLVATAAMIWKARKILNPVGAFFAALGASPVAAADYCSRFQGQKGLLLYFSLDIKTQMAEADKCPELVDRVIKIDRAIRSNMLPEDTYEDPRSSM